MEAVGDDGQSGGQLLGQKVAEITFAEQLDKVPVLLNVLSKVRGQIL